MWTIWCPNMAKKDAVRIDYPPDPLTDKQPINSKRMESLLSVQIFKEFRDEASKMDNRQKRVGAAKRLVEKRVKDHKKKAKSTANRCRRKSSKNSKHAQRQYLRPVTVTCCSVAVGFV